MSHVGLVTDSQSLRNVAESVGVQRTSQTGEVWGSSVVVFEGDSGSTTRTANTDSSNPTLPPPATLVFSAAEQETGTDVEAGTGLEGLQVFEGEINELLSAITNGASLQQLLAIFLAISNKISQTVTEGAIGDLQNQNEQIVQNTNAQVANIQEANEAAEKAKKSGAFSKAFGWLGFAAGVILAALAFATGVGAVAGTLLIAGLVTSFVVQLNTELDGEVFAGLGEKGAEILGWVLTGLAIVLSLAGGIASSFGSGATKLVETLGSKADLLSKFAFGVQTGASIAGGATNIVTATHQRAASEAEASQILLESALLLLQEITKLIERLLEVAQESSKAATEFFSDTAKTLADADEFSIGNIV